ncbi:hypothetical protein CFN78_15265 [Amycolatopsis antarctica]|uniref:Uncharacterized protein n=1 Tax=Amycolatopsis antarctica TaxID=1854586 RepID=A0A263D1J1_9PSEU|nr:hypothetical protein CFN78_15265 [Amycolatopsis antarctica]
MAAELIKPGPMDGALPANQAALGTATLTAVTTGVTVDIVNVCAVDGGAFQGVLAAPMIEVGGNASVAELVAARTRAITS